MPTANFGPALLDCPGDEQLWQFATGLLDESSLEQVAQHVESCSDCDEALDTFESRGDPLVDQLRHCPASFVDGKQSSELVALANAVITASDADVKTESLEFTELGPYQVICRIGQGGMGTVYKARNRHDHRLVALKIILPQRTGDRDILARFENELKAVAKLNHPNIVQALDAGAFDGRRYLALEYIDGADLKQLVSHQWISIDDACEIVRQIALGLEHAHQQGLLHRDVKPSNVMLTQSGQVKLLDLGLARLLEDTADRLTATGQLVGTADYIAPEQALDSRNADVRSDIYSLGCTLAFLLTGKPPFEQPEYATFVQKALAHAKAPLPDLNQTRDDIPAELHQVLTRTLAKSPVDRFASAGELAKALEPLTGGANLTGLEVEASAHESVSAGAQATVDWNSAPTTPDLPASPRRVFPIVAGVVLSMAVIVTTIAVALANSGNKRAGDQSSTEAENESTDKAGTPTDNALSKRLAAARDVSDMKPVYWDPAAGGNGHRYLLVREENTWQNAKSLAEQMRVGQQLGHLVGINDVRENSFVANEVLAHGPAWIGLTDDEEFGGEESRLREDPKRDGWTWVTGEPAKYTSWGSGRPQGGDRADYVFMYAGGSWDDGNSFGLYYIVEFEPPIPDRVSSSKSDSSHSTANSQGTKNMLSARTIAPWMFLAGATITLSADDTSKHPLPTPADQKETLELIKGIYKDDYAKKAPADQVELAKTLLKQTEETKSEPTQYFVLAREAARIAAEIGDSRTAFSAVDLLCENFALDEGIERGDILAKLLVSVRSPNTRKEIVQQSVDVSNLLIQSDHFREADDLLQAADRISKSLRDKELTLLIRTAKSDASKAKQVYERVKQYFETLETTPDDAVANYVVGRYKCFFKGDWTTGLPLLAIGSSETLQQLAKTTIDMADEPNAIYDIAGQWWSVSEKLDGVEQAHVQMYAGELYRRIASRLSGLRKAAAEKKVDLADEVAAKYQRQRVVNLIPLMDLATGGRPAEKWSINPSGQLVCTRGSFVPKVVIPYEPPEEYDFKIVFSQPRLRNEVCMIMPKNGTSFAWAIGGDRGHVKFTIEPASGGPNPTDRQIPGIVQPNRVHTVLVQVRNMGVRAIVDGNLVAEYRTDFSDMTTGSWWSIKEKNLLAVGCDDPATFHTVELREIRGRGKKVELAAP